MDSNTWSDEFQINLIRPVYLCYSRIDYQTDLFYDVDIIL